MKSVDLDLLKEALPYILKFKNKIFVIKISGNVVSDTDFLSNLAEEIVLLHQVGFFPVIVHGGGKQLSEMAKKLGVEQTIIDGRRVTNRKTLELAKMVFVGQINTDITAALRSFGARTVGLSGFDGQIILAKKRGVKRIIDENSAKEKEIDYGFVGDIVKVDTKLIKLMLDQGYIPVISSMGSDVEGHVYNINADTVAAEITIRLSAEKLIMITQTNGILRDLNDHESQLTHLDVEEAKALISNKTVSAGMIPKIQSIVHLIDCGISSVHIIGTSVKNPLLQEIFTDEGAGTMITGNKKSRNVDEEKGQ